MFCCTSDEASGANGPCTPCVETLTVQSPEEWITGLDQNQQAPEDSTQRRRVVVTFERPDGHEKEIHFYHRPLGIEFSGEETVVVQRVHRFSQGEKAKVEMNWVVRAVDESRTNVLDALQAAVVLLPEVPPITHVTMTFRKPEAMDKVEDVMLRGRPLGITFTKTAPLRVKTVKPHSHSAGLGISRGWILLGIDGEPLPQRLEEAMEVVQFKVSNLPDLK
ncbi:unnamed protein product [Durusdinium trenchii]|uniref:PDZ domain-containing protein n=2 Tax=Durusdinium trenchii TaxID=1381693 RepID=A0ABP0LBF7_9DINO